MFNVLYQGKPLDPPVSTDDFDEAQAQARETALSMSRDLPSDRVITITDKAGTVVAIALAGRLFVPAQED